MKFSIVRTDKKRMVHLTVKEVDWFLERIQTDTKARDIGGLRDYIASYGDTGGYEQSTPIAMIHPSVELKKQDNGLLKIVAFNSLVTLHVAGLFRLEDIEAVKQASRMLPMTFASFIGADGRSVEILVSMALEGGLQPRTEQEMDLLCQKAYELALGIYGSVLPKTIERQTVTARSCFRMPLDAKPYYNPQPTPLTIQANDVFGQGRSPHSQSEPVNDTDAHEQREVDLRLYSDYEQMYRRAAEEAYDETIDVIEGQRYDAYITELARRLCLMGMPEEEAFLHIRNHHVYKAIYDEDTFRAIVSAVYTEEKPSRQKDGEMVSRETRQLIRFLTTRYVFRYNTVMGYTECRQNNTWSLDWQPCDENAINGMTLQARLDNLDVRDKDVRRYVHSDMIRKCDPVADYIVNASDKWDHKTDHIALLARCVPCDIPQWERWFKKWFVSMVAQWLMPTQEYGNSIVPLLISPQGDGKSSFCRMLLPKELRWGFLENLDVSEKKSTLQAMHNFLLINLDEFNSISPKQQEGFLKNVIQLPSVKIKRPYGKHVEEFKRYASFIATTNETNVLSDPTGSRRFICVGLTAPIDTSYKPNYEALYGQAYHLVIHERMDWWFGPEEVKEIIAHNQEYQSLPPAMLYFNEYFEPADSEEDGEWLSPTAIYDYLRSKAGSGLKATGVSAFGRYLKNMPELKQKRVTKGRFYLVRKKK